MVVSPRNEAIAATLAQRFADVRIAADNQAVHPVARRPELREGPDESVLAFPGLKPADDADHQVVLCNLE